MKEFLEFLRESVNSAMDRLRFPFFNSFIVSWLIFNWKPVIITLFSEEQLEARIAHVTFHYSDLSSILYYPLLSATLYTILTPMLKYFVAYLLTDINKENRDSQYDFVIDSYTKKNILAAKQYEYQLSKEGAKKVEELSTEIEKLKAEKEKVQDEKINADLTVQNQIEEIKALRNELTEITVDRDELDAMLERYKDRITDHENEITKLTDGLNNTKQSVDNLLKENNRLEKDLSESNERVTTLQRTLQFQQKSALKLAEQSDKFLVDAIQNDISLDDFTETRAFLKSLTETDVNEIGQTLSTFSGTFHSVKKRLRDYLP